MWGRAPESHMTEPSSRPGSAANHVDVYADWLGIDTPEPSYYDLLGLPPLAGDTSAVMSAGRHAKRQVRMYQIGPYRDQALRLLAEIGNAVSVLMNPEKKRAYDLELMARWKDDIQRLYGRHCTDAERTPAVFEAWLVACRDAGVPVARLMPLICRTLRARGDAWPPHGEHDLSLPAGLCIYRDVVILGRCTSLAMLEKRVRAVQRVQRALAISEGIALLIGREVGKGIHLFARERLAQQAEHEPEAVVLRLARRIRRMGGRLEGRSKVLGSAAALVGIRRKQIPALMERIDESPVDLPPGKWVAQKTRERIGIVSELLEDARDWLTERPGLLFSIALAVGAAVFLAVILVVAGIWHPWPHRGPDREEAPPPERPPLVEPEAEPARASPPEESGDQPPPGLTPEQRRDWENLRHRYPADAPPNR